MLQSNQSDNAASGQTPIIKTRFDDYFESDDGSMCYVTRMKTQTKNQNSGWAGKAQQKQQTGYLSKIAKQNKGKNLLAPEKTDEAAKNNPTQNRDGYGVICDRTQKPHR